MNSYSEGMVHHCFQVIPSFPVLEIAAAHHHEMIILPIHFLAVVHLHALAPVSYDNEFDDGRAQYDAIA